MKPRQLPPCTCPGCEIMDLAQRDRDLLATQFPFPARVVPFHRDAWDALLRLAAWEFREESR